MGSNIYSSKSHNCANMQQLPR